VSPCWGEQNFVKVSRCPIVFRHLEGDLLRYAGTRTIKFDPTRLVIDKNDYLLYKMDD
jgi:hypothetical protein